MHSCTLVICDKWLSYTVCTQHIQTIADVQIATMLTHVQYNTMRTSKKHWEEKEEEGREHT